LEDEDDAHHADRGRDKPHERVVVGAVHVPAHQRLLVYEQEEEDEDVYSKAWCDVLIMMVLVIIRSIILLLGVLLL